MTHSTMSVPTPRSQSGRRSRSTLVAAVLACSVAVGACGSDGVGPGTALSELELQTAVTSIFQRAVVRAVASSPVSEASGAGPMAAPVDVNSEVIETFACTLGGEVETLTRIEGTVDDVTGVADLEFYTELDHLACIEGSEELDVSLDLQGFPGVQALFEIRRDTDGEISGEGGLVGTVRVITESANLNCPLNIGFTAEGDERSVQYGFAGTFCELGVQATFTSGPDV